MATTEVRQAISELVEKARLEGQCDPYIGKRQWKRYCYGTRLEVTRDPAVFASSWYATTHDVSAGGVGFWSKQAFSLGDHLFVRERSTGKPGPWLASHVKYCVTGMNGFLVGTAFDQPGDADAYHAPQVEVTPKPPRAPSNSSLFCSSLRNLSGLSAALAATIVYFGTLWFCRSIQPGAGAPVYAVVGAIASSAAGFGMGWLLMHRESYVLRAIYRAMDGLSCGVPETTPLPEASTREVTAVRRSILDLGIRWQQQADLERVQRQRLEEISQIKTNVLSTVSHDLRTPLTSIQLYAQMMEEDLKGISEEDQHKFLGIISEESTRLSRLVDDLLEVQRLERDDIDWPTQEQDLCDTVRAVARAFEPIAANNGLRFDVYCPDSLPKLWCNSDKLAQAINNFLSNALKFTPAGGRIELSAAMSNAEIVVSVTDTGKGIPREKWDAIFDRFVQLADDTGPTNRGVGLGLHITRQIVERHKGRVWLDSEVGVGTAFFIALPIHGKKPTSVLAVASDYVAGQVVVCDADPELASVMAQELQGHGFEVRQAYCAARLFEQISERHPDVVICDVALPDMGCQEFLERLKQSQPCDFQLVLHPTAGSFEDPKRLIADIVLRRPVTRSELVEAVGVAMYKRAGRGAVIIVVAGWGLDSDRVSQVLTASGYLPILAKDMTEAIQYLQRFPVDAVFAIAGPEGAETPKRYTLERELPAGVHLFLLIDSSNQNAGPQEVTELVSLVPYRSGQEEAVPAALDEFLAHRKVEVPQ